MPDKHKVRIRKSAESHQEWLDDKEGQDILSSENRWEGHAPWAQLPLSDMESDRIEALQNLYPLLKGRQKQIVTLLFDGYTSHTEIAKRLRMRQSNVTIELRKIMKKILKNII